MKYIYLLVTLFIFSACSKEKGYGRFNLRDGQEVELLVSHRYGAINDDPLLLPQKESAELPLSDFIDREPGYNYKIKAKMVAYNGPELMDGGPSDGLQFIKIINKEKYTGKDPFKISLIGSFVPAPPQIILRKEEDKYLINIGTKIQFTYTDQKIGDRLEEIWQYNHKRLTDYSLVSLPLKWKSIQATVTHDPKNFGKAYLVSDIKLVE